MQCLEAATNVLETCFWHENSILRRIRNKFIIFAKTTQKLFLRTVRTRIASHFLICFRVHRWFNVHTLWQASSVVKIPFSIAELWVNRSNVMIRESFGKVFQQLKSFPWCAVNYQYNRSRVKCKITHL